MPREPISWLDEGRTGEPPTPGVGVLLGIATVELEEERLGVAIEVDMPTGMSPGRAETPAMTARATEKKVEGFIVIVVR